MLPCYGMQVHLLYVHPRNRGTATTYWAGSACMGVFKEVMLSYANGPLRRMILAIVRRGLVYYIMSVLEDNYCR